MSSVSSASETAAIQQRFQRAYRDLEDAKNQEIKKDREQHKSEIDRLETSYQKAMNRKDEETDRINRQITNAAAEQNAQDRRKTQESIEKMQRESYDSRGKLSSAVPLKQHNHQIRELAKENDFNREQFQEKIRRNEDDFQTKVKDFQEKNRDEMTTLQEKHKEQLAEMDAKHRSQLQDNHDGTYKKIAEMNNSIWDQKRDHQDELKRVDRAHVDYANSLKRALDDKDQYYGDKIRKTLGEKDQYLSDKITETNHENQRTLKDLETIYSSQIDHLNQQKQEQDRAAAKYLEARTHEDHETMNQALTQQAAAHEADRQHINELQESRFRTLQENYDRKTHPKDVNDIPVDIEDKIKASITQQYDKNLNTEIERNRINQESLAEGYGNKYRKALEEMSDRETQLHQQVELERTRERNSFFDTLSTTQENAQTKSREQDLAYQNQLEKIQRKFAYSLDRQRREYESIIESMKNASEVKLMEVREINDQDSKQALKNFNEKQSEIIREYDRRLSEQREQYEYVIEDLKAQMQSGARDNEKRSKQELEVQAKNFEQKIAQLEDQNKEHERYLSQSYQEQLDKLRRSYELTNQQKKS